MVTYEPGPESDLLVLGWWDRMATGRDLEQTVSATIAPVGAFMAEMRRTWLLYEADADGIWFAAWFDRVMAAGAFGVWIREDMRQTRRALLAVIDALARGLERFPVLILATMQPAVMNQAEALGFAPMGTVPWLFDGQDALIGWIDSKRFYTAIEKYRPILESGEIGNG